MYIKLIVIISLISILFFNEFYILKFVKILLYLNLYYIVYNIVNKLDKL